jgi:hypothetical protein
VRPGRKETLKKVLHHERSVLLTAMMLEETRNACTNDVVCEEPRPENIEEICDCVEELRRTVDDSEDGNESTNDTSDSA